MDKLALLFRWGTLSVILVVFVWLLIPPADEEDDNGGGRDLMASQVKYVIKFAPGQSYMPDTVPYGIGQPLQGLKQVIRDYEREHRDTKIEVVATPGRREYLVTQLTSGSAPDIVNWNVEDVWADIQKGWYVALDPFLEAPNRYVVQDGNKDAPGYEQWWDMLRYQAVSRGKAAPDGKNYCLTFDMVETGIFYNKTIFDELGLSEPTNWEEMLAVMAALEEAGKVPLAMVIDWFSDWTTDILFDQLYYGLLPGIDLIQDPVREQYLEGYLDWDELCFLYQKGFFTREDPRYVALWEHMKQMRRYCSKNLVGIDPTRDFVTQEAAMIWNASAFTYRLTADKELDFEWGVFYLPHFTAETSPYASLVDSCVIGGSATQLEVTNSAFGDSPDDPAKSERLKRVIDFLQYLTMPENYQKVVNEYACFIPNIKGVPVLPTLRPFEIILDRRYTTTKWVFTFDLKFGEIQRRMLELYLNNGTSLEGFLDWQEDNLKNATDNLLLRKEIDMEGMQKRWEELAPVRAQLQGLPPAVVESDKEIRSNG